MKNLLTDLQRLRLQQAAGFASLLNEILGCGALGRHGDSDLIERVQRASRDNEKYFAQLMNIEKKEGDKNE